MIYIKRFLFVICQVLLFIGISIILVLGCVAEPFTLLFHYLKNGEVETRRTLCECYHVIDNLVKIANKLNPDKND